MCRPVTIISLHQTRIHPSTGDCTKKNQRKPEKKAEFFLSNSHTKQTLNTSFSSLSVHPQRKKESSLKEKENISVFQLKPQPISFLLRNTRRNLQSRPPAHPIYPNTPPSTKLKSIPAPLHNHTEKRKREKEVPCRLVDHSAAGSPELQAPLGEASPPPRHDHCLTSPQPSSASAPLHH